MKNFIFVILLISFLPGALHAIIDGRILTKIEESQFSSFISLSDTRTHGGGVHIGQGIILTAAHVFLGFYDETPSLPSKIILSDSKGAQIAKFSYRSQGHVFNITAKEKFIDANGWEIQSPDLAIYIPPQEIRKMIVDQIPVANWRMDDFDTNAQEFILIGIGEVEFNYYKKLKFPVENKIRPKPYLGRICKYESSALASHDILATIYKDNCAAGGAGDSGSPLWQVGADNKIVVRAITAQQLAPDAAEDGIGQTLFTRLDSSEVQNWIEDNLKKNPLKK